MIRFYNTIRLIYDDEEGIELLSITQTVLKLSRVYAAIYYSFIAIILQCISVKYRNFNGRIICELDSYRYNFNKSNDPFWCFIHRSEIEVVTFKKCSKTINKLFGRSIFISILFHSLLFYESMYYLINTYGMPAINTFFPLMQLFHQLITDLTGLWLTIFAIDQIIEESHKTLRLWDDFEINFSCERTSKQKKIIRRLVTIVEDNLANFKAAGCFTIDKKLILNCFHLTLVYLVIIYLQLISTPSSS